MTAIKQEVRDDLYWTFEGVLGSKFEARAIMNRYFDKAYKVYGDTKMLYTVMYNLGGLVCSNNVVTKAA